ncbi:IclR family transcriptional regulator [Listeria booriae]|uniref:IclR family transcriptional regulator n=1 Tax=Listeria booriae TaxID=1552123 RepID=UPI001624EE5E|nr:IclR family transcriptional regulator [Listeria booriae]MBC2104962.1 IclR family transcriptional regulator [Listeria booriae]
MKKIIEDSPKKHISTVQSVDKALLLLRMISESKIGLSINDLIDKTGFNRTTIWRSLNSLAEQSLIERNPQTKLYTVGTFFYLLSNKNNYHQFLIRRTHHLMKALCKEIHESVHLSLPLTTTTITIEQLVPEDQVKLIDYIHVELPLHSTSSGKIVLSTLEKGDLEAILSGHLTSYSPSTITEPDKLRAEIARIKEDGYATVFGELETAENGLSLPILDANEQLIAVLSVSGPEFRFTETKMQEALPIAKKYRDLMATAILRDTDME